MCLKIAIQKKGRLSESSISLLKKCDVGIHTGSGKLKQKAKKFPLEILYLRDDDIPQYVYDGVADIGIVGENILLEKEKPVDVVRQLGFAACRLSIAIKREDHYDGLTWLNHKKIATSYPRILQQFLDKHNITATIEEINGSVEIAPGIGLAEAVFDIISTGSTLLSNGLKEVEKIIDSQAVLIKNNNLNKEKINILEQLVFRIKAIQNAEKNKYILLNIEKKNLNKVIEILPGIKSPTVCLMEDENWVSIQSVVPENGIWEKINQLKEVGAEGILVCPIEKMIY